MAIKLADAFIEVLLDYAKAEKDAANMDKTIGGITEGTMTKLGAGMTAAGAAITGTLGVASAKAAEFGENLANVSTLGVQDLGALDEGTRDLAVKFGIDLNDAMKATYETISAGIPEDAAIMVMEQAARGAQAGVGSLGDALDLGTSVMNAWNLQGKNATETTANMEKIMGMAATAAFKGKTTFADMATSIGQVAPVMATAGIGTEEFFAAVSALTATGKPTSSAMLQLQQAVSNVIKPSEQAAELADQLGIEFNAASLESKGLAGFLDMVKEATGGNVEQMGVLFGSVEALGAVLSLTGNQAGLFKESITEMSNAQKNLADMSDAFIRNNPGQALKVAKAALQELFIMVGRTVIPALAQLAKAATPVMQAISDFIQDHPKIAMGIGTVTGAIGFLMLAVGGLMLTLGPLLLALPTLTGAGGFAGLMGAITGAGTAAGAAAGAGGFGALLAVLTPLAITGMTVAALAGIIAIAWGISLPTIISTANAFWELAKSNQAVNDQAMQYAQLLKQQGVDLDLNALDQMKHSDMIRAINDAALAHREANAAREIQAITGVEATRQQIHIAELARIGLGVSAREAAFMATQGITQAEIEQMMLKCDAEETAAQRSADTQAMAVAASSEAEEQIRQDKTATIGHFQWAADKEAQMLELARKLKTADHYERKLILSDLARMEEQKAAAERQWAMENQALTAGEIAAMNYKAQQKEAADARWVAITEGRIKADQDMLYKDQDTQLHSIKVQGDAITRQKAWEAEQRKKTAEMIANTEKQMEDQIGKDKLEKFNAEISKIQELGDFQKLSAEQLAQFKKQVMKGEIDASIQYWQELSIQANQGYVNNLKQYQAFTAQMKAEAASLRQAMAYAMNPDQTGSPSLNMQIADGYRNTINLLGSAITASETMIRSYRDRAVAMLTGLGPGLIGSMPTPSVVYQAGAGTPLSGGTTNNNSSTTNAVNVNINASGTSGEAAREIASAVREQVGIVLGQTVRDRARARGVRQPGVSRTPRIPAT